ncbi:MAG: histidine--tRNA ligase [Candidatus Makana argininalis]
MSNKLNSIKGTRDFLPEDTVLWQKIETTIKKVFFMYGYSEIRFPILEKTSLFNKSIGNSTDLVNKEMYSFQDKNGKYITLRPEGTSCCTRVCIEHGLLRKHEQRLWYIGSMFRYEKPQQGRYRQFYQAGIEIYGHKGPYIDVEIILLINRIWNLLGLNKYLHLNINSIGSCKSRMKYINDLYKFLNINFNYLDEDSKRKIKKNNIFRILDSKNEKIKFLLKNSPKLISYLDNDSYVHFKNLCNILDKNNVKYNINTTLVRGLDYYNKTVFEWTTDFIGSKNTVCGGGRYDYLTEKLGGINKPAIGCSIGLDRIMILMKKKNPNFFNIQYIDLYIITSFLKNKNKALIISENLRNKLPYIRLITDYSNSSFNNQFKKAFKYHSNFVLILKNNSKLDKILLKNLITGKKQNLFYKDIIIYLKLNIKNKFL